MTSVIERPQVRDLTNRDLIDAELWGRLVNRLVEEHQHKGYDVTLAERILDQALGFLRLISLGQEENYSPSPMVDDGWHMFILYTRDYAAFCQRLAGQYLHHEPSDRPGVDYGESAIANTVAAMKAAGIAVDEELWGAHSGKCTIKCSNTCSKGCTSPDHNG
jgi:hypothetical protein